MLLNAQHGATQKEEEAVDSELRNERRLMVVTLVATGSVVLFVVAQALSWMSKSEPPAHAHSRQFALPPRLPRVYGAGLSHTGTNTLIYMLGMLGMDSESTRPLLPSGKLCSARRHGPVSVTYNRLGDWLRTTPYEQQVAQLLKDLQPLCAVADIPWNIPKLWRSLTVDHRFPGTIILTTARSPLDFAVTSYLFPMEHHVKPRLPPQQAHNSSAIEGWLNKSIRLYVDHVRGVRAAHRPKKGHRVTPAFAEMCWECGDDITTLARALRVRVPPGLANRTIRRNPSSAAVHRMKEELRQRFIHLQVDL